MEPRKEHGGKNISLIEKEKKKKYFCKISLALQITAHNIQPIPELQFNLLY